MRQGNFHSSSPVRAPIVSIGSDATRTQLPSYHRRSSSVPVTLSASQQSSAAFLLLPQSSMDSLWKAPEVETKLIVVEGKGCRRISRCCVLLLFFGLVSCFMLTIGVNIITSYAVNHMYPYQMNIQDFEWEAVQLGPMVGSNITVVISAKSGGYVPVNIRIPTTLNINLTYHEPASHKTPGGIRYFGQGVSLNEEFQLLRDNTSAVSQLNLTMVVEDHEVFGRLVMHLLSAPAEKRGPIVLGIDVYIPRVDVMWGDSVMFSVHGISVNKTTLIRDPSTDLKIENLENLQSSRRLFTLLPRIVSGDPMALHYATKYIQIDGLVLYDDATANNSAPALMQDLLMPFSPANLTLNGTDVFDSSLLTQIIANDSINAGNSTATTDSKPHVSDSYHLPFSILVHFINPSVVSLLGMGAVMLHLSYNGTMMANVTVPGIEILPNATTSTRVYGYLRKINGSEHVLEQQFPSFLLQAMPITIGGIALLPENTPKVYAENQLSATIQRVLANFQVPIGERYADLTLPSQNNSVPYPVLNQTLTRPFDGINQFFSSLPVLGTGRLGDTLHGLRFKIGWGIFKGKISVNVYLVNPFSCQISISRLSMRVYSSTHPGERDSEKLFLGWVELNKESSSVRGPPIVMDAFSTMDGLPLIHTPFSDTGTNRSLYAYPLPNSTLNSDGLTTVQEALTNLSPQLDFTLSWSAISPTSWGQIYSFFSNTLAASKFRISLRVDALDLKIGSFKLNVHGVSQNMLEDVALVPTSVVDGVGWKGLVSLLMGDGWEMTAMDGQNAYNSDLVAKKTQVV